ncbi:MULTISPECIES: GNAT family N-acetyltransferase [Streptomycetaceae]|uniref:Putative acetyltransferase n=1 Tax=Streptantibioticus cattleyicolor (strain ATCC 35852 / DSM 46488 / JCM 4925 / NBRC 14057 / NRRL 8057) TaxID=1003195 RepID=F8JTM7_STREN|nr:MULTISPECIES: GNAT family protein [Streptomycetaceae]AEW96794.1 putative acetyltransferase [Streptantibioticus cattleyicolor NRRL 8057 = DSM 46488]MYS61275.1 GNAT family N-acetyltransferase [Streptomyces sp. SID5468]CCB77124.1 Acetyltransferase, ribosomal protein N-acetylase [Streptantibioticus cattleyicolor NRRL 8057 = DSM 46488]
MSDQRAVRVHVRPPRPSDAEAYTQAVLRSAEHIGAWNPVEPDGFPELLRKQGPTLRTFLILDEEDGGLVGKCNVSNIVRGRFRNASLGYDSYLPYAGTGRMTEGMRKVVDLCFARPSPTTTREGGPSGRLLTHPDGLALHRLEISVQPGNTRSIALAKRLGFRYEGFSPRMLYINDAWRDHERFALTAEEWPGV